jgi:hypothetical protein
MAEIKPVEKSNRGLIIRVILISFLILGGLAFNRFYPLFNRERSGGVLGTGSKSSASKEGTPILQVVEEKAGQVVNTVVDRVEEAGGQILGEAEDFVADTASKSAEAAKDFIFDSTVGNLLKQVDKLPDKEKEDVKRNICQ